MIRATVLAGVLAAATACTRAAPPSPETPASIARTEVALSIAAQREGGIETAVATITTEPEMIRVSGRITLADDRTWRVGVRTNGVIGTVRVGAGDYVTKGQVLARYHADELRDSRARYRAAHAELARAQSAATLAQRNLARAATLYELKAASQQQVEQARQDVLAAQAEVRSKQTEVDRLMDLLEDDLHVPVEPQPGDAEADQVPIIAPASGYILEKNVTLGKAIDTMDDTFVIGDLSQVWMLASVRQDQLGSVSLGQLARVTVAGVAGQQFEGRITNLGQELDPRTRTMQVRIALSNSGNRLRPEMLATADIPAGPRRAVIRVGSDAIQQVDGQDVVFVKVAPERFVVRPIQSGETRNGDTTVLQGLKAGEEIVVKGSFIVKSQLLRATLEEGE